ncbi:hypothetical protein DICVIV_03603 [Dictyocaulus viviparus]|uniref:Uncharacterized protein n=1 Tax=Dictyocaulus viviparus TaxID=29172 RepID=A0A0D8Y2K2_DICVI|nr:hypothetical protein DICVIV_03603 [Dictyocaulus viviparus]
MLAENVPGHMGQLPVEQLVHLIEGSHHPEQHSKKQNNKDKPLSVVADAPTTDEAVGIQTTKKERRRKSKELKEISSISNAVNIGALQTKTGGSQAAGVTATLASAVAASQTSNIEIAVASKRMTSTGPEKQCDEKIGIDQNCRCSTEDGEEEFLSADEGVASSVGDEPCVSTIPSTKKSSPTFRHTPEVTQYNVNNKVVDKNTVKVEHQCTDEQEFITVNTKKKKLNEISGMPQRNSYISKDERLQRFAEHLEPTRRSSLGIAPESRTLTSVNSPMPSNRRPTTASLADFMNEKDGGKIHKKLSPTFVVSKSARKSNKNEMSKPDPQNVGHESPERTFSYADAAKKSSEPSRDNSPACVAPTSPAKSDSSATLTSTPVLCSTMQMCGTEVLPSSAVSGVADGLSFFYDESEATFSQEADEATASSDDAFVLQLGEKTVRFVKGMASTADIPPSNSHHMYLVEMLAQRWKMFQEGQVPQIYQPRMISS